LRLSFKPLAILLVFINHMAQIFKESNSLGPKRSSLAAVVRFLDKKMTEFLFGPQKSYNHPSSLSDLSNSSKIVC